MQRAKVHRKYGRYVISVAFAPPRNIEMFDNRSWLIFDSDRTYSFVSHSHRSSTPFSHLLSLPFLPLRSFHFLLSFFLPPSSSFWPKTDSGHGSSTTAGRPFCMPRVPCHTRQQARKSNFHRETYYTRRLVHIHDRGSCIVEGIPPKARNGRHYRVAADSREGERERRRRRNTRRLWKLCCHCDWRLTKGATHILLLFLRFRERQEISLLLKYDCCSPLCSNRCSFE